MKFENDSTIGAFRIVRPLGQGGMGDVYEVEHVNLGVHYALKTYVLEDAHAELFRKRFAAEGRLLARLSHPNLVRVIDLAIDEASGVLYYVMDLVLYKDGYAHTLADLEPGGADEDQIFEWFKQICSALAYVHSQGIVHRDIKLNNILLAPDKRVVLSDFGISRVFSEKMRSEIGTTKTMVTGASVGIVVGTQGYMAPEVEAGEPATPAADVYALGVVFFKLLTGVWYDGDLEPVATRSTTGITDAARLLSGFERPWKDVLPAMLAKDPARRPADLDCLPRHLTRPAFSTIEESSRKHSILLVAALATLVLALAALAFFLLRSPTPAPDNDRLLDEAFAVPETMS